MKKHYLLTNLFIFCFLVINAQNSPSVKFKSIIKPTFRQTSTLAAQIDSIELYNDKTAFFMTVTIPYERSDPKRSQIVIIFGLLGFVLSCGYVVVKEPANDILKSIKS